MLFLRAAALLAAVVVLCGRFLLAMEPPLGSPTTPTAPPGTYACCYGAMPEHPAIVCCLRIQGTVLDFTQNHGRDRRIYSRAIGDKRDLYVYLPPGYCPDKQYPLMIVLHGILQDERAFLDWVVKPLDDAIVAGKVPPLIVAAPDGSFTGDPNPWDAGSFFINGPRGNYQSWIEDDLWFFLLRNFSIRPEPEAHVMAGASMGGVGAFNIGLRHPERLRHLIGLMPP
ncbi:MAG TPA: alpha/beta hydrolase-fold protein, partial [Gemmatales bacterium]|nr:alpha/beta hydrolase-fold protein [Gemmatales bacterium]